MVTSSLNIEQRNHRDVQCGSANLLLVELLFAASLLRGLQRLAVARSPPLRLTIRIDIGERLLGVANLCRDSADAVKVQRGISGNKHRCERQNERTKVQSEAIENLNRHTSQIYAREMC